MIQACIYLSSHLQRKQIPRMDRDTRHLRQTLSHQAINWIQVDLSLLLITLLRPLCPTGRGMRIIVREGMYQHLTPRPAREETGPNGGGKGTTIMYRHAIIDI